MHFLSFVPKIYIYISFRYVDLHHCCYLFITSQLSTNQFMNILSDMHVLVRPKSHSSYHVFTHFSSQLSSLQTKTTQKITVNNYKTIFPSQFHNISFRLSNATPPRLVSINSRYVGMCRFLSNVALLNITNVVK